MEANSGGIQSPDNVVRKDDVTVAAEDLAATRMLLSVGGSFMHGGDLQPVLDKVVEAAIAMAHADRGSLQLLDPESGVLEIRAHRGFEQPWVDFWRHVEHGKGTCGTAMQRGDRVVVDDVTTSPIFAGTPALAVQLKAGVRAVVSTPLRDQNGRIIGMFSVHYSRPHRPDELVLQRLDLLALLTADVVGHARQEEALRESEERFRTIFDTSGDGMFVARTDGSGFVMANRSCLRMLGYSIDEFIDLRIEVLHRPEDLPFIRAEMAKFRNGGSAGRADLRFRRKDGTYIMTEVTPTGIRLGGQDCVLVAIRDVSERSRLQTELLQSRETLRALLARIERTREEERTRVARDIHDDLGQNLTALKMDLHWITRALEKVPSSPELAAVKTRAGSSMELADAATATVQEIASALRPGVLDRLGLGPAIRFEAQRFQTRTSIPCRVRLPESLPATSSEVTTALFRIFQECLTNIARHAGARQVAVSLDVRDDHICLCVSDNGTGIDVAAIDKPESLGLFGIKERASALCGEAVFLRRRRGGTVVEVRIPRHAA